MGTYTQSCMHTNTNAYMLTFANAPMFTYMFILFVYVSCSCYASGDSMPPTCWKTAKWRKMCLILVRDDTIIVIIDHILGTYGLRSTKYSGRGDYILIQYPIRTWSNLHKALLGSLKGDTQFRRKLLSFSKIHAIFKLIVAFEVILHLSCEERLQTWWEPESALC